MAVTLKQIADAAGVSRGTVDRVINKRGHVRPEVEKRILQIAKDLHYRPNPYGRALVKSTKTSKIGVICQFGETPFMKLVVEGIEQARKEITARGSEVIIKTIDSYDTDRTLTAIDRMLSDGVEGLALTAGPAPELQEKLREVIKSGIPVITFNTDSKESGRLGKASAKGNGDYLSRPSKNFSMGMGWAKRKPCAIWQPAACVSRLWASVSMPSTKTVILSRLPSSMTCLKMIRERSEVSADRSILRSIFIISIGMVRSMAIEE